MEQRVKLMADKTHVKRWMRAHREEYRDQCMEINCTGLAEAAADEFNIYENTSDYKIPEWVFDFAVDVSR
jgi:hypothetical protein